MRVLRLTLRELSEMNRVLETFQLITMLQLKVVQIHGAQTGEPVDRHNLTYSLMVALVAGEAG